MEVPNELANLWKAIERLDAFWVAHEVNEDAQADLNIAIEEILTNVMRHNSADEQIGLAVAAGEEAVTVEIRDRGRPFNPLAHPEPGVHAPLEQRRGGGLGIYMAIHLMDETSYERKGGYNCFRMVRRLRRRN